MRTCSCTAKPSDPPLELRLIKTTVTKQNPTLSVPQTAVITHNPRITEYYFSNFLMSAPKPRVTGHFPGLSITLRVMPYGTTDSSFSK